MLFINQLENTCFLSDEVRRQDKAAMRIKAIIYNPFSFREKDEDIGNHK